MEGHRSPLRHKNRRYLCEQFDDVYQDNFGGERTMRCCPSCGGIIGRDCFNVAECAEISAAMNAQYAVEQYMSTSGQQHEKLQHANDQLRKELEETRQHFKNFASFVGSCQRENTYEWMVLCLDWLNGACRRVSPESYFILNGHTFGVVKKAGVEECHEN